MVQASFHIKYSGAVPYLISPGGGGIRAKAGTFHAIRRGAWEEVGEGWASADRPKHFTREGAREYGYQPRVGESGGTRGKAFWRSYTGQKQKYKGHTLPMVWSGELLRLSAMRRIVATSAGTRSKLRVILPAANKANFKPKRKAGGTPIDLRAELTTVSEAEGRRYVRQIDAYMDRRLRSYQASISKRI